MSGLSPSKEFSIWGDLLLSTFPSINNGLMEVDQDVVWALEAATYSTAADRIRTIYGFSSIGGEKEYDNFVAWLFEQKAFENFADFANFMETHDAEICQRFGLWDTLSYLKLTNSPFGTLDFEDNIEAIITLLDKMPSTGLGSLLFSCYTNGYLSNFIDYFQQIVSCIKDETGVTDGANNILYWNGFVTLFEREKESIRYHLRRDGRNRWLYC